MKSVLNFNSIQFNSVYSHCFENLKREGSFKRRDCFIFLKCYYDKKLHFSFFLQILKACLFDTSLAGKILSFEFYTKLFSLSASLGFHGIPLFTFKIDRFEFRGLDRG